MEKEKKMEEKKNLRKHSDSLYGFAYWVIGGIFVLFAGISVMIYMAPEANKFGDSQIIMSIVTGVMAWGAGMMGYFFALRKKDE